MRTLVTGGSGFIGSNLVDALVARGDEVTVVDDLSTGREANLAGAREAGAELVRLDIRDAGALEAVVAGRRPGAVFHLAAQIDVRRSVAEPGTDSAINVTGTVNVLEAARRAEVPRFVFASTGGAIYGEAPPPTPESAPERPLSAYGQAKLAAEGYAGLYARLFGLSTVCLRFANVYGPRQDPLGEGGVCAIFCGRALSGGRAAIFGDGLQTRDFVYVGDVVDGLIRAGDGRATGSFNIGTGTETSVLDLVTALRELLPERPLDVEHEPPRTGEVLRSALDASRARAELGWEAGTGLTDGLERTLAAARAEVGA